MGLWGPQEATINISEANVQVFSSEEYVHIREEGTMDCNNCIIVVN